MGQPTQSNKLYRKVKHRYRPNMSPRQRPTAKARHDQAALAASAEARGATHRARPRSPANFLCHPYPHPVSHPFLSSYRFLLLHPVHRRFIIQRGHEHTRTGNCSESGFGSLRGAPWNLSRCLGGVDAATLVDTLDAGPPPTEYRWGYRPQPLTWPLHDIVITNIVWCSAYKREVGRGVVYCPRIVH